VCAAGNSSENIDSIPSYPAAYPLDNIITVGASDNRDLMASFSNYGSGSVDLFAPGESILSTYFSGNSSYMVESGTSMATPFVTGAVALLRTQYPSDTYRETINRVMNGADAVPTLAGKSLVGGRLNLFNALATAPNTPPNALFAGRIVLTGFDPYTKSNNQDSPLALEPGTPALASGSGHSLWWEWTAPQDAEVEIDTSGVRPGQMLGGSSFPTALVVYTGSSLSSLSLVASNLSLGSTANESIEGGSTQSYSMVSFHASAGTTYQINVQGQNGSSGAVVLAVNTQPDHSSMSKPMVVSGVSVSLPDSNIYNTPPPTSGAFIPGSVSYTRWYEWTAPKSGPFGISAYSYSMQPEVSVYTFSGSTPSQGGLSLVSSERGGAASGSYTVASQCVCSFQATAGTTYLVSVGPATADSQGEYRLTIVDSTWQISGGDSFTTSPTSWADGTVYIGGEDNSLYAVSPSGSTKWIASAESGFDSSSVAIASDGTVYAGSIDGYLYALNPSGTVKWKFAIASPYGSGAAGSGNSIGSSPSIGPDGTIYFHGSDGNLYAVSPGGVQKWTFAVPGDSYAAPTIGADGTIFIGTDTGLLFALNPDGTEKWEFTAPVAGESIYTEAAIDSSGNLYVATLSGNVYSLSPAGKVLWSYASGASITSAPALSGGNLYFGSYDGNLSALTTGGALLWKCPVNAQVRASAPAVDANGNIYIGSYDGNVYEVSPTGSVVRIFATGDAIRSSPLIAGGMLYFGSEDHKIYGVNIGVGPSQGAWPMYQNNAFRIGRASGIAFSTEPVSTSVAPGSGFTLYVAAQGYGTLSYQWSLNGQPIEGATSSSYSVASASAANSGVYTVQATDGIDVATSSGAIVTVAPSSLAPGRIVNLSARSYVGTGGSVLIAGFVVEGTGSKSLILRGVGPTLATYGVSGTLPTPVLDLFDSSNNAVAVDTAWQTPPVLPTSGPWVSNPVPPVDATAAEFAQWGAFALPVSSGDTALSLALPAGGYTSEISGAANSTGVALAEIYDTDSGTPSAFLANISARAYVGTGSNILIAGFVIQGDQPVTVLLRGVGPTLTNFGLTGCLAQPELQLVNASGKVIQTNQGWSSDPTLASAFATAGAFTLNPGSADAAMIATLSPGAYTVELSGAGSSTGIALVEVYLLP
jgi:outer membrane protein assembly factor BamB